MKVSAVILAVTIVIALGKGSVNTKNRSFLRCGYPVFGLSGDKPHFF